MPTAREIKGHIASIRSIAKVTRALETVSAVKNHRLRARLESTRIFAEKSWEVLIHLASAAESYTRESPFFCGYSNVRRLAMLLISSDRGMVGTYNLDIIALATDLCYRSSSPVEVITIGKIGRDAMLRQGFRIHADFSQLSDVLDITAMTPVARVLLDGFRERVFDRVTMVYTQFGSGLRLRPIARQLLPVCSERPVGSYEYIYEPEPPELISALLPRLIRFQVYEAFLEALCAENASRMMAMRSATRNAQEIIERLTVNYNKARQQAITAEIMDIVSGVGSVGGE